MAKGPKWSMSRLVASVTRVMVPACLLVTCSDDASRLYPLTAGSTWTYEMSAKTRRGSATIQVEVTALELRDLAGKSVVPLRMHAEGTTSFVFMCVDSSGIFELAKQEAEDAAPRFPDEPVYSIKHPIEGGTSWTFSHDFSLLDVGGISVPMEAVIESTDETVTVPAGTFTRCVHTVATGSTAARIGVGLMAAETELRVESHSWYAPQVGLIKGIARETSNNLLVGSAKATMQLISYEVR